MMNFVEYYFIEKKKKRTNVNVYPAKTFNMKFFF